MKNKKTKQVSYEAMKSCHKLTDWTKQKDKQEDDSTERKQETEVQDGL